MGSSRLLHPVSPGGLYSPNSGDELTAAEELVIQAIAAGSYFVFRETPSGTINGVNATFALASAPNPAASLCLFLNGQLLTYGTDYTLSGSTITMITIPDTPDVLRASYTVDPN